MGRREPQAGNPPSKWHVYEKILRVPYYVIFSRYTNELQIFHLVEGNYQRMSLTDNRFFMPELGLSLGLWSGRFREINGQWLRWMTPSGELIPTDNEQAILAEERATAAEERAIAAEERAQQLAQRLRELGIDPDNL